MSSPEVSSSPQPSLLVACLCAEWCATCREYQTTFQQIEARFEALHFVWIDIEDEAELVDPVDVVDFPTLLVARDGRPVFFGPLPSQPETLARLLQTHVDAENDEPALASAELHGLVARILARG